MRSGSAGNHAKPVTRRRRNVLFGAAAMSMGLGTAMGASFTASWLLPADGTWSNSANWSTNPNAPNNGTPAGATYDAVIAATGASYTATLNSSITVDSLTLGDASATLNHTSGTFRAINGLNLTAGTYRLAGGTISNTTITSGGGSL